MVHAEDAPVADRAVMGVRWLNFIADITKFLPDLFDILYLLRSVLKHLLDFF